MLLVINPMYSQKAFTLTVLTYNQIVGLNLSTIKIDKQTFIDHNGTKIFIPGTK